MLRLNLKTIVVALCDFVYIFREDDILPPGFTDGGFLNIAVVYFYSNVLVVGAVFEGKSATRFILSELLMGSGHLMGATCSDEPLVSILL